MKLSTDKKIGKNVYTFTGEGKNLYDCLMDLNKASFGDVSECGNCNSDNLYLESHLAQGKYKYTSIKCAKCRSSLTFGKREDDDNVFFLRRKEDGSYDWQEFKSSK